MTSLDQYRTGYVAIIGRPNVGKSTLLNRFIGEHLSIVSPKPQTTRHRVTGVLTRHDAQLILVDTPGFHTPAHLLGKQMMQIVHTELHSVDIVLLMLDATAGLAEPDRAIASETLKARKPMLIALNKIDRVPKPSLLPLIAACTAIAPSVEIIPISAMQGDNIEALLAALIRPLPIGPPLFPSDQLSDQQIRFFIAETIREQVLLQTHQEIPHSVAVIIDAIQDEPSHRTIRIHATILVERSSQKGILIGQGGQRLKAIGSAARPPIEAWLERQIFLQLWVKVRKDWREDPNTLRELGYVL